LAGIVETAVNALWDAAPLVGDRITVVGGGVVGCCVAIILARFPGVSVEIVDANPSRAEVAMALGVQFATPDQAAKERDVVIHTSATSAGLRLSTELLSSESTVIELSWYGNREVSLPLGESFHSRRLSIRSSQVGTVSPARRGSRSCTDRLTLAVELLRDPAFDALFTSRSTFDQLPDVLADMAAGSRPGLFHLITYGEE
jgi:threonine dehydrogenase-like Zn-dependent dehydrogenase